MSEKNIEKESALQAIELLKQYLSANTVTQKAEVLDRLHNENLMVHMLVTKYNHDPEVLVSKMEKALHLDKYRPKNLPIPLFAISQDLEFVNGEFDTFNPVLNKMFKNNEDPKKIRQRFMAATINMSLLAKQFSADWIRRLRKHPDLVIAARNTNDENAIEAYNNLFEALVDDFSKENNNIQIHAQVVPDWRHSDIKPQAGSEDFSSGISHFTYGVVLYVDMSEEERKKISKDYEKHPKNYPLSLVRINIANVRKKTTPDDFFYMMISLFAHEMHHALDAQQPRLGALGPQVAEIDRKIYIPPVQGEQDYFESATEMSSYEIQKNLFLELKNIHF